MKNADLIQLRQAWINTTDNVQKLDANDKSTAFATLLVLSADVNQNNADLEISRELSQALTLALKLDSKQLPVLDDASQVLVRELTQKMQENVGNAFISSLADAAKYLRENAARNNSYTHAARVFQAIEDLYQSTQEIPGRVIPIDIQEGEETFRFYFHGESYPHPVARREVVVRLWGALATLWNDAVETGQLELLINNIKAGPCVEAATRDAMEVVTQSITQRTIASDFETAVGLYYQQAVALLNVLKLPVTFDSIRQLIIDAYNGTRCVPKENKPNVINEESVTTFITAIAMHETKYTVEEKSDIDRAKQAIQTLMEPFSILARDHALRTLSRCVPSELLAELLPQINGYANILKIIRTIHSKILSPSEVKLFLANLYLTKTSRVPILGHMEVFLLLATCGQNALVEAMLESGVVNLLSNDNYGNLLLLKVAQIKRATQTLKNVTSNNTNVLRTVAEQITAEALCRASAQGPDQGLSALFLLVATPDGIALLKDMLQQNPNLYQGMTAEALCRPLAQGPNQGISALFLLVNNPGGLALLKNMLEKNPNLYQGMTAEALCRPIAQGPNQGISALIHLLKNPDGRVVLKHLLQTNQSLYRGIAAEALCRPIAQGPFQGASALVILVSDPDGLALLKNMLEQNPNLYQGMTAEALCRPIAQGPVQDKSALYFLVANPDGRALLKDMLQQNPNLYQGMIADALCRPAAGNPNQGTSPLYWLVDVPEGQVILKDMLQHNPNLYQGITAEALCRPVAQGQNQGKSPLSVLMGTEEGQALLKQLVAANASLTQDAKIEEAVRQLARKRTSSSQLFPSATAATSSTDDTTKDEAGKRRKLE